MCARVAGKALRCDDCLQVKCQKSRRDLMTEKEQKQEHRSSQSITPTRLFCMPACSSGRDGNISRTRHTEPSLRKSAQPRLSKRVENLSARLSIIMRSARRECLSNFLYLTNERRVGTESQYFLSNRATRKIEWAVPRYIAKTLAESKKDRQH